MVLFNESGGKHGTQVHVAKVWAVMVIELGTKKTRRRRREEEEEEVCKVPFLVDLLFVCLKKQKRFSNW